jgi:phosphoglycerate dehydrogenase-like enzyme
MDLPLNVTVLDDYQGVALSSADWSSLAGAANVRPIQHHVSDEEELRDLVGGSDVLVVMRERTPIRQSLLAQLPQLRLIVTTGPFNAAIDVAAANAAGITVCGTGGSIEPTVELTWALILGLARRLTDEDRAVRAGRWQTTLGTELAGSTLGIVGLGRIGSRVAAVASALGMESIAWSQHLDPERAASLGVRAVTKSELFSASDVVTLHLVLSERTVGIVGANEFAAMRSSAILVNTSRGPIVDEQSLVAALHAGRIAGAGLDVFDVEPLPAGSPLRRAPRTLLTPHIGYVTDRLYRQFYREVVEDIEAFISGRPIRVVGQ